MSFLPDETSLQHQGNVMQTNMYEIEISSPILDFLTTIAAATRKMTRRLDIQDELDQARRLLESLPFSTEEYGLACNRLRNAGRFVKSGEYGAASWELKTLRSWVLRQENTPAACPRRRRWMQSV